MMKEGGINSKLTALDVAGFFIQQGALDNNNYLTNMQVQKLVYLANGYHLGITGRQLFDDEIQAWKYGPVIPNLYYHLRRFGNNIIEKIPPEAKVVSEHHEVYRLLKRIYEVFGHWHGWQLSALTHEKDSPWFETWQGLPNAYISPDVIRTYYRNKINQAKAEQGANNL